MGSRDPHRVVEDLLDVLREDGIAEDTQAALDSLMNSWGYMPPEIMHSDVPWQSIRSVMLAHVERYGNHAQLRAIIEARYRDPSLEGRRLKSAPRPK